MTKDHFVCIIDDDEAIRESLRLLLYAGGLRSCVYESADIFLSDKNSPAFDCMLLDIRMPGTDGLELFKILSRKHLPYPVIFITGHGDIPLAVSAIKQGAYDFLTKPFREGELLAKSPFCHRAIPVFPATLDRSCMSSSHGLIPAHPANRMYCVYSRKDCPTRG